MIVLLGEIYIFIIGEGDYLMMLPRTGWGAASCEVVWFGVMQPDYHAKAPPTASKPNATGTKLWTLRLHLQRRNSINHYYGWGLVIFIVDLGQGLVGSIYRDP